MSTVRIGRGSPSAWARPAGLAGCGLLLQYLPGQAVMLILAATEAAGVAYCSTRRELWQARWPDTA